MAKWKEKHGCLLHITFLTAEVTNCSIPQVVRIPTTPAHTPLPSSPSDLPSRGLTPWTEGEQPDGQNHRGAHCESAWGWGEDGLNYIFPGFEGGLCMTHSSCFHLKLISKYHYK